MNGLADLAQANLRALRDGCNVFDLDGRAVRGLDDGILDVLNGGEEAGGLHVDLLRALLDEAASAVGIIGGDLLLDHVGIVTDRRACPLNLRSRIHRQRRLSIVRLTGILCSLWTRDRSLCLAAAAGKEGEKNQTSNEGLQYMHRV